jgi:hypothetical protein
MKKLTLSAVLSVLGVGVALYGLVADTVGARNPRPPASEGHASDTEGGPRPSGASHLARTPSLAFAQHRPDPPVFAREPTRDRGDANYRERVGH